MTRDELKSQGIPFTESQLLLLETWKLLRETDDTFETMFPILDQQQTTSLREYSITAAPKVASVVKTDVMMLTDLLKSMDREKSIYSILFAYILDGLVWDEFEKNKLSTEKKIFSENPFWGGVVWAVYPPKKFNCGTNTISDKGIQFKVNWSRCAIPKMIPFVADWKNFGRMFDDYSEKGKIVDPEAKKVFAPFNLFDDTGNFTLPVIEEKSGTPLYDLCLKISKKIAELVPETININEITEKFDFQDNKQAMVIIYHELMWDVLDNLEKQRCIQKPIVFSDPKNAKAENIADLVFIVKRNK